MKMGTKYKSYIQGLRETAIELGDKVPDGMLEGDEPPVDETALDLMEYMRGQITALLAHIKSSDAANHRNM
jgi:hypothetical protein